MTTIIQLNQLSFAYGNRPVLSNLDLTVQKGEILGLVGPNGAGKTTLINLIQGVLTATPGSVTVFGGQPGTRQAKSKIATMFQDDLKLDNVTVTEFLNVFASQADNPQELATLVNELNLSDIVNQPLGKLSGGQRRKVSFASAVIANPQLLFLDEPTVGMDAETRQAFWHYINQLRHQKVTVIITSHYLEEIQAVADRIAILQDERFSYIGTWQQLQTSHTTGKLSFTTALAADLFTHLPGVQTINQDNHRLTLTSSDTDLTLKAIIPFVDQIHDLIINRESLESIFLQMTAKEAPKS